MIHQWKNRCLLSEIEYVAGVCRQTLGSINSSPFVIPHQFPSSDVSLKSAFEKLFVLVSFSCFRLLPFRFRYCHHSTIAFEFDSSCRALWGALQLESNSNASIRRRFEFKIFKRPKNREDGSKFDDFWTKSIASGRTKI